MLVASIARGDSAAAYWLTDVFQKWLDPLRLEISSYTHIVRRPRFVTPEIINSDWQEIQAHLEIEPFAHERLNAPSGVYQAVLRNYWVDCCCLAIYLLILWGKHSGIGEPLALRVVKGVLDGEIFKAGGGIHGDRRPLSSLNDLLSSLLRQYFADGGHRNGYRSRLDKLMELLQDITSPEMVSGRVYSGYGGKDLDSVKDGQIFLLCSMAKSDWSPTQGFTNDIRLLATSNDDVARDMLNYLQSLITRLPQIEYSEWSNAFSYLRGGVADESGFNEAKQRVEKATQYLIDFIKNLRNEELRTAQIDPNRLLLIARSASNAAFKKESAEVPVSLFDTVEHSNRTFDKRRLIIENCEKGEYTDPLMAQLPGNEAEWSAETVKDHVTHSVMADIITHWGKVISVDASTPERYWQELKNAATSIVAQGLQPILLIESLTRPSWIWDWGQPHIGRYKRPDDLHIKKQENETAGYIAHLNETAVYQAPIAPGASLVLPRETFKRIVFTNFQNGYPVEVSTEGTEKDELVNLIFEWAYKIDLDTCTVSRLEYHGEEE